MPTRNEELPGIPAPKHAANQFENDGLGPNQAQTLKLTEHRLTESGSNRLCE